MFGIIWNINYDKRDPDQVKMGERFTFKMTATGLLSSQTLTELLKEEVMQQGGKHDPDQLFRNMLLASNYEMKCLI